MHILGRKKELHIYAHEELEEIVNLQLKASKTELDSSSFCHPLPENGSLTILEDENI